MSAAAKRVGTRLRVRVMLTLTPAEADALAESARAAVSTPAGEARRIVVRELRRTGILETHDDEETDR